MQQISTIQNWFRAKQARRRYLKLKQGITRMQALVSLSIKKMLKQLINR